MACTSFTIPASPASSTSRIFEEQASMKMSYSVNHVCYRIRHVQAKSTQTDNNSSSGVLCRPMNSGEEGAGEKGEEIKRANWVEKLVELRSNWRNVWQQKEVAGDVDNARDEDENGGDCCSLEENGGEIRCRSSYDCESFSRFLVRVPLSETKLFSQLAFLCNIAYVIPDIKAVDLERYYGLQFVTSSLEKKAEEVITFFSMGSSIMTKATAKSVQQSSPSPCAWFVCDEPSTSTRCFVIQGLDSQLSWKTCLLFEPTKFEETNVVVHRGIYEAAKEIYDQFMPDILDHLETNGEEAKLQFTDHCIGGSIAVLVHLMLLTRGVVKPTILRPVVTFGSPFVFCGGQRLLGLPVLDEKDQIHCVMMHRDIVPRAFSCNYTNQVVTLLKCLHGSFQSHPCLIKNKTLYSPMGKLFILQPQEKSSPPHPLLPMGSALYALDNTLSGFSPNVYRAFLNSPHPLETIRDPTANGSEGTILQDHDSCNYLKAMNGVLRQHTRMVVRKVRKQRNLLWPPLASPSPHSWKDEDEIDM